MSKKNNTYVEIQNGKKAVKAWVADDGGFEELFNMVKGVIFDKDDKKKDTPGFIKNEKKDDDK